MSNSARWTWLVYMAGDNNLEGAGRDDLKEMQQVGSTADVNVLVQFDTEEDKTTRYRVEKKALKTLQTMKGVNCGDPEVLADFIRWGIANYPADHILVDVWNHGGGWENLPPDYDYSQLRGAQPQRAARLKRARRAIFKTTIAAIAKRPARSRAIAIDCGCHDYLDNQELRKALSKGMPPGRQADVLGCDACLMNMVEIAYEMKDTAAYMVGSEETEPGAGWPYAAILKKLVARPTMAPEELVKIIVTEYGRWFKASGEGATQSALDLGRVQPVADAIDGLAGEFLKDLNGVAGAVSLARDKSQKFEYPEYIDLGDFAAQLIQRLPNNGGVVAAADKVLAALQPASGTGAFVVQNATTGTKLVRATGVSIYFPRDKSEYAPDYKGLLLSKSGGWRKLLEGMVAL